MDRSEIIEICEKYKISNYIINDDMSVDVNKNVLFMHRELKYRNIQSVSIKFNIIKGSFKCYGNKLYTLNNTPNIVTEDFNCSRNQLTSLVGGPNYVGGHFNCSRNQLTSLKGLPMIIYRDLRLNDNPISIIDSSIEIHGNINIDNTNFDDRIKSLSQEKLRILFEHGVDYDIFRKDGSINDSRLERLFKDFNI